MGCGHKIVLQEDMSYGRYILRDNNILMGGHVLQKNLSHGRTFLLENMSYGRVCLTGGYIL